MEELPRAAKCSAHEELFELARVHRPELLLGPENLQGKLVNGPDRGLTLQGEVVQSEADWMRRAASGAAGQARRWRHAAVSGKFTRLPPGLLAAAPPVARGGLWSALLGPGGVAVRRGRCKVGEERVRPRR